LSCFVELYGYLPEFGSPDHRFDAGFTFLITNMFQLDLSGGLGLSEISPDYFISTGFSVKF
jgi:outer membrane putative beta-barrel porin/alpha-amylase